MPSKDKRYLSALEDIKQHTVNFKDWPDFWFFDDDRFQLKEGSEDEPLLLFLCEMFHPAVLDENSPWKEFLNKINELLYQDGYELYSNSKMSGRNIYSFHEIDPNSNILGKINVFTCRYSDFIIYDENNLIDNICNEVSEGTKEDLISILGELSTVILTYPIKNNPNFDVKVDETYLALKKLNEIHRKTIIELNEIGCYGSRYTDRLKTLFTPFLFDLIELQFRETSSESKEQFATKINAVFNEAGLPFTFLECGCIELNRPYEIIDSSITKNLLSVKEPGLIELLNRAVALHKKTDMESRRTAMEVIWDAFERLKTYYPDLDKKKSVKRLIDKMACEKEAFIELFNDEFKALTDIGNNYQIRHHETIKIPITDIRQIDYFFNRCLSLVALAIQYLSNEEQK